MVTTMILDNVKEAMEDRGYEYSSSVDAHSNYYNRHNGIHARVQGELVELWYYHNRYNLTLSTGYFAVDHPLFGELERKMMLAIAKLA